MSLVALDPDVCPSCGATLSRVSWYQDAILRHGGYGATERRTARVCPSCAWTLPHDVQAVPPGLLRPEIGRTA